MNMNCQIRPQGEIDAQAGEFWVNNPFEMLSGEHNFSAYEQNKFLLNREGSSFVDLSHESTANLDSDSRSAIAADFDRDGDLDLLVGSVGGGALRLFQNRIPVRNRSLRVELHGTQSHPSGFGARVTALIGKRQVVRDVFPSNGFMGHSPGELIFGCGEADTIDELVVRWPSGQQDRIERVGTGGSIVVVEGQSAKD